MPASQKLSKQVAQELRRHVKRPRKNGAANAGAPTKSTQNGGSGNGGARAGGGGGHGKTLAGCVAFVGVTASMPIIAMRWIGSLNDREEALTHAQIRRGAFNNSGSRDVGKDPMWDFSKGVRKQDKEYVDLFLKDNPNEIDHGDKFVMQSKTQRR